MEGLGAGDGGYSMRPGSPAKRAIRHKEKLVLALRLHRRSPGLVRQEDAVSHGGKENRVK